MAIEYLFYVINVFVLVFEIVNCLVTDSEWSTGILMECHDDRCRIGFQKSYYII